MTEYSAVLPARVAFTHLLANMRLSPPPSALLQSAAFQPRLDPHQLPVPILGAPGGRGNPWLTSHTARTLSACTPLSTPYDSYSNRTLLGERGCLRFLFKNMSTQKALQGTWFKNTNRPGTNYHLLAPQPRQHLYPPGLESFMRYTVPTVTPACGAAGGSGRTAPPPQQRLASDGRPCLHRYHPLSLRQSSHLPVEVVSQTRAREERGQYWRSASSTVFYCLPRATPAGTATQ